MSIFIDVGKVGYFRCVLQNWDGIHVHDDEGFIFSMIITIMYFSFIGEHLMELTVLLNIYGITIQNTHFEKNEISSKFRL